MQPNIVFIMSDDHAARAISAYGSGINNTPTVSYTHLTLPTILRV